MPKREGHLFEKLCDMDTLREAYRMAKKNRSHTKGVIEFEKDVEGNLHKIQQMLLNEEYRTSMYRRFVIIDKGKRRKISALPFYPDRVIHWALILTTKHIFMHNFIINTYAAIPGRGTHMALQHVKKAVRHPQAIYAVKMDIHRCFESIDKNTMMNMLEHKIKDPHILSLYREVIFGYPYSGLPIGNLTSQYLANFYLSGIDHFMKEQYHCKWYFRYMDDIIIIGWDKMWLHRVRKKISLLLSVIHMSLNDNWQVFPIGSRGVDFVGYRIFSTFILLRNNTKKHMKQRTSRISRRLDDGETYDMHMSGCVSAYHGILSWCDGSRLHNRYIDPIYRRIQYASPNS